MSELENKSLNNRKLTLFEGHERVLEKTRESSINSLGVTSKIYIEKKKECYHWRKSYGPNSSYMKSALNTDHTALYLKIYY